MILVTGGAGFIGSNYIKNNLDKEIVCIDKLSYASNIGYIQPYINSGQIKFHNCDILNGGMLVQLSKLYNITHVVNFAAETHVDNSINDYKEFISTNVLGTIHLMEFTMKHLYNLEKFIHISTDEVYGSLELDEDRAFTETSHYETNSPYSASKAAADCFVRAFHKTYGLPTIITNCSNNYGPNQHKEKFIPTIINSIKNDKKIPVYGDGLNIRDWLYVDDHCDAINLVLAKGVVGEKYNIGGGEEVANIDLVKKILKACNKDESMIEYVKDRAGHDRRYAIDCSKIERELGYKPKNTLEQGLEKTIGWYLDGNK